MSRLAAALLLCLACGCVHRPDPKPPEPEPPVADSLTEQVGDLYAVTLRQSCLDAAKKLRAGEWTTDRQYLDGHRLLMKDAVEAAGKPFADRQQSEATPFDPDRMAEWLERMGREGQP